MCGQRPSSLCHFWSLLSLAKMPHYRALWTPASVFSGAQQVLSPICRCLHTNHCSWLRVTSAISPLCSPEPDPRPLPVHQDSDHGCCRESSWISCHSPSVQFSSVQFSRSVMSDCLQPHELQRVRPPCPSPTPGVYPNSGQLSP